MSEFILEKRITILVGDFGSGKTELAVSFACNYARQGHKVAIVDLDLVKPYFRTRESRELMENEGVRVIAPAGGLAHADLPILPHHLHSVMEDEETHVIIDVGGGEGALVLGQLQRYLKPGAYECYFVINTFRPFTGTLEAITQMMEKVKRAGRVQIHALISNSNLAQETSMQDILLGYNKVVDVAEHLQLPIRWVVVPSWLEAKAPEAIREEIYVLQPATRYPWME
jgi:RecA/RadA recombinase